MSQERPIHSSVGWWRSAVIYQVYVRSFADGNGDGTGDLAGVRRRLRYLRDLGVDALWFNPWYPSPMADGGYDVVDYRNIDPAFGTLAEAEALIREARAMGIRTIVDIVPNHVSDQHPWFREAIAAPAGSPARERFWFRPGQGSDGDEPPNGWASHFGAGIWRKVWHVTMPQLRHILLITLILQVIATFQVFTEPFLMTGGGPSNATVTVLLQIYNYAFRFGDFGAATALSLLLALFLAVLSAVYFRVTRGWSTS